MAAIVAPHNCKNEFQDKTYGKGNRLFNWGSGKGAKPKRYRCTVCGQEKDI